MKGFGPTRDRAGRPYAKLSEIIPGEVVTVDSCFPCMSPGHKVVFEDDKGKPYLVCDDGRHFLDGQADDGEHLVGVYR